MPLVEFRRSSKYGHPQMSQKAKIYRLQHTYTCETGFSAYVTTKTKHHNRLDCRI